MQFFMWLGIAHTFPQSYPISEILGKIFAADVGIVMSKIIMKKFFICSKKKDISQLTKINTHSSPITKPKGIEGSDDTN